MSFGPSKGEKSATTQQQAVTSTAQGNSADQLAKAGGLLNMGGQTIAPATNWLNTILGGNQANTAAMLQPDINRIREGTQGTLQAMSTLMPRGGGRAGALFSAPFAENQGISGLFNNVRSGAAGQLAGIGLQQQGLGTNLFGIGNQPLNTAMTGTENLFSNALAQRQASNNMWAGLGGGLFNLATTPFGGSTMFGKLGGLMKRGGGGGTYQGDV